ncbi:NAD-dependent dihydropyrimidine dehydrogenase subunit PreA [Salinivirga cyanobacteriivorans]|uniref:NAD-dependent dihydropyrimidine dehydrogenase subunit PreA n=1 Tax=Salinivirga cyanobacteriivorans TaxID=1307839 RepID=A0A0S2HWX3_9BACT|nr:dihydroorotate dehydrogenase-like protein [Salinivirga cyanobacteriivorans]ALO14585.1 NAD-dependent dihydropyrimidine dehydrogenase subunit PreA [Salinivirga cyanobacteriivorans]
MANLETIYLGLKLKNPIVAASSEMTGSVEDIQKLEKAGAGAVVLKSLFEEEIQMEMEQMKQQMTGKPYVYPETMDYMDEPVEEDQVRKYLRLIKEAKSAVNIPIIASINCVSSQKWTYLASEIEKAGADAIELNMFILPTDFSRSSVDNEKIYHDVVNQVSSEIDIPVAAKVSYYFSDLGPALRRLSETRISGLTLFNRFFAPDIDIDDMKVTNGHVLSSPSDIHLSLRWVAIMANRVECDIAATTGVHSGRDVIKQLLAGADVVQVASVLYRNGATYIAEMLQEVESWMDKHKYATVEDFRGRLAQEKSTNPAAWERAQFMRHFSHFVRHK